MFERKSDHCPSWRRIRNWRGEAGRKDRQTDGGGGGGGGGRRRRAKERARAEGYWPHHIGVGS